jgi:hypothetical protein
VWYTAKIDYLRASIFNDARSILHSIDSIVVSGVTGPGKKKNPISFHIEGFRRKREDNISSTVKKEKRRIGAS